MKKEIRDIKNIFSVIWDKPNYWWYISGARGMLWLVCIENRVNA